MHFVYKEQTLAQWLLCWINHKRKREDSGESQTKRVLDDRLNLSCEINHKLKRYFQRDQTIIW